MAEKLPANKWLTIRNDDKLTFSLFVALGATGKIYFVICYVKSKIEKNVSETAGIHPYSRTFTFTVSQFLPLLVSFSIGTHKCSRTCRSELFWAMLSSFHAVQQVEQTMIAIISNKFCNGSILLRHLSIAAVSIISSNKAETAQLAVESLIR